MTAPVFEEGERVGCVFPGESGTVLSVREDGNAVVRFDGRGVCLMHVRHLRKLDP